MLIRTVSLEVPMKEESGEYLTCYGLGQVCLLTMHKINNVPLGGVGVAIFELEDLVHAVFFERGKLYEKTQQPSQVLPNDQVLLPAHLATTSAW